MSITRAAAELTRRTAKAAFFQELRQPTGDMGFFWMECSTEFDSDQDQETYPWLGQVPQLERWVGLRKLKGLPPQSFTIENLKWEASFVVDNDLIRRDKLGQVAIRGRDLARRTMSHKERLAVDTLIDGEATNCYDGQFFFDNDHQDPGGFEAAQDNLLGGVAAATTIPTVAEFETAMDEIETAMMAFTDDRGEPFNLPMQLHVIVPPAYARVARIVLGQVGAIAADATGTTGAFRGRGIGLTVTPYLPARQTAKGETVNDTFYVLNKALTVRPLIYQTERDAEFETLGAGSEHSFKTDTTVFGVNGSYNMGYGPWQGAVAYVFT